MTADSQLSRTTPKGVLFSCRTQKTKHRNPACCKSLFREQSTTSRKVYNPAIYNSSPRFQTPQNKIKNLLETQRVTSNSPVPPPSPSVAEFNNPHRPMRLFSERAVKDNTSSSFRPLPTPRLSGNSNSDRFSTFYFPGHGCWLIMARSPSHRVFYLMKHISKNIHCRK